MLEAVYASPAAVAAGDKAQWISIFARYNIVEDPVGSAPHLSGVYDAASGRRGKGPLSRFFDTFIAPNTIVFHVRRDIVCHETVVRDLDIEIAMGPVVRVSVPMHLVYELVEERGELRIFRLAAHWEFLPMVTQAMGFGWDSLKTMGGLGWRMFRQQGIGGILGFCRALSCVGERGKLAAAEFARAWNMADEPALASMFDSGVVNVEWPSPRVFRDAEALLAWRPGAELRLSKLLAAGHTVSASFELGEGPEQIQGVLLFEFTRKRALDRVCAYWQQPVQATSSSSGSG